MSRLQIHAKGCTNVTTVLGRWLSDRRYDSLSLELKSCLLSALEPQVQVENKDKQPVELSMSRIFASARIVRQAAEWGEYMSVPANRNFIVNFSRGFFAPFRSVRILRSNPRLIQYILIPFLINAAVFSGAVYLGLDFFGSTVVGYIPQGEAWYWSAIYWFIWIVAVLLTAVLVFFSFTVVGNLLASPFNDLLSERTEEVLCGSVNDEPFSLRGFFRDALKTMLMEAKKMWVFVVIMVFILPLNLLPGIGNIIYTLLAVSLTLFFLCFEYLSFVFVRKHQFFRVQKNYIFARKFLMLGFSCGVMVLLSIPFLQLFCIPLAVIGATRIWCEEEGLVKYDQMMNHVNEQ